MLRINVVSLPSLMLTITAFFDLLYNVFLFIPRYGLEVGLLYGQGKPLGREHADGGTAGDEGRDEVGRGAQGELKVGVLGGGA